MKLYRYRGNDDTPYVFYENELPNSVTIKCETIVYAVQCYKVDSGDCSYYDGFYSSRDKAQLYVDRESKHLDSSWRLRVLVLPVF